MSLKDNYLNAKYRFQGSGLRNVNVLKEAFSNFKGNESVDIYGNGDIIEDFENKFANILGKESAVFMPSGTMAQQIALRIYADKNNNKKVGYHPLSHLEIHEQDAAKVMHNIKPVLLGEANRLITLDDIKAQNDLNTILIELPQREIGGVLPSFEELKEIADYARNKDIYLHLDGARLFECIPFYKKTPSEIAELFDSVYISFYKGIGAIAGAILAGKKQFIEEAKVWKRRQGGDLISLYPYIVTSNYYYEKRIDMMGMFYDNAKRLATSFNELKGVETMPKVPVTNMFHVYIQKSKQEVETIFSSVFDEFNVSITNHLIEIDDSKCKFEMSIGESFGDISNELYSKIILKLKDCFNAEKY